jgi:protein subunit release factor A
MKITTSNTPRILVEMRAAGILKVCRAFNSGGPGGQHGNRSMNAIELVAEYRIDGVTVEIRATASLKSQHKSRTAALRLLASKLKAEVERRKAELTGGRRVQAGGFGAAGAYRVRTYHEPDNRVIDSAGFRMSYAETAGKGRIVDLVDRRRVAMTNKAAGTGPRAGI